METEGGHSGATEDRYPSRPWGWLPRTDVSSGERALCPAYVQTRRGFSWRALFAGAYAMQSLPFATSNKLTTAANAIFLQSTSPVLSAVWAWTFRGERPAPWSLASAATTLAATALHAARRM